MVIKEIPLKLSLYDASEIISVTCRSRAEHSCFVLTAFCLADLALLLGFKSFVNKTPTKLEKFPHT